MAREPIPSPARSGQKRQWNTAISCCSNYDLNYELYREDVPYRLYDYQRTLPFINHVPDKSRRTHIGMGVKGSFSPHRAPRKSHLLPEQIKMQTGELHSIRGALSQIKAHVDRLLESLEHMEQHRNQHPGQAPTLRATEDSEENRDPRSNGSSCRTTEPQQEPRDQSPSRGKQLRGEHRPGDSYRLSRASSGLKYHLLLERGGLIRGNVTSMPQGPRPLI